MKKEKFEEVQEKETGKGSVAEVECDMGGPNSKHSKQVQKHIMKCKMESED